MGDETVQVEALGWRDLQADLHFSSLHKYAVTTVEQNVRSDVQSRV